MSTKLFITAIVVLSVIVAAGVFFSMNRNDSSLRSTNNNNAVAAYTVEDVKEHDTKSSCWTIISGSVYDLTSYLPRHPGGEEILRACGADSTSYFEGRRSAEGETVGSGTPHSKAAREQLQKLKIGTID